MKRLATIAAAAAVAMMLGCGSSYAPPQGEVTGAPAAPLGRVLDLDIVLPHLQTAAGRPRGATLTATLSIEGNGEGRHAASIVLRAATAGGMPVTPGDLSNGKTFVTESGGRFQTTRIGPLRIDGGTFELLLQGSSSDGGWTIAGESWESQSGLTGTFSASRRHRFLVTTSDFGFSGAVALVSRRGGELVVEQPLALASPDPALRRSGAAVFVINRLSFDNLQRLDPQRQFTTSWQAGVGGGSNPHDVLLWSDAKAYVSRYEPPFDDLAVIDPRGGAHRGTIPLDAAADNQDGTPRADQLLAVGGELFVGVQNIDRTFTRYGSGRLAVIDPQQDRLVQVIELPGKNPGVLRALVEPDGRERIYVALAGVFPGLLPQELSGGVAVVDVRARLFERWALSDDDAGGNVAGLALASAQLGYAVISGEDYRQRVIAFDPSTGTVLRTVAAGQEFIPEIEVDGGGVLVVPDRSFNTPQICLYAIPGGVHDLETPLGCARLSAPPFAIEPLD